MISAENLRGSQEKEMVAHVVAYATGHHKLGKVTFYRMDDYHVAFGKLIDGFDTLDRLESYGVLEGYGAQKGRTTAKIVITQCGQLPET